MKHKTTFSSIKNTLLWSYTLIATLFITACQESKPERFEREAKEYTERNCPQRASADGMVILDSLVYHQESPTEIIYYYSIDATGDQTITMQMNKEALRQQLLSSINSSVDLKNIKAAGLTIIYLYRDKYSKKEIMKFSFSKDDYTPVS